MPRLSYCHQKLSMFESDIPVIGNDWKRGEDVVHGSLSVGLGMRRCEFDPHDQVGDCDCRNCNIVVFVDQIVEIDGGSLGVDQESRVEKHDAHDLWSISTNSRDVRVPLSKLNLVCDASGLS
jgi:hypothetical protein